MDNKERSILFSTDMVKAIQYGRKTQTRRVIIDPRKRQRVYLPSQGYGHGIPSVGDLQRELELTKDTPPNFPCPYGQVGDRLWGRETWTVDKKWDNFKPADIPEGESVYYPYGGDPEDDIPIPYWVGKIRPSIHMPRWASRITLEITEVRVERVQEIGQVDISKEGIELARMQPDELWTTHIMENRGRFANLWDSLNAKRGYGWEVNPFVWVISFKVVK